MMCFFLNFIIILKKSMIPSRSLKNYNNFPQNYLKQQKISLTIHIKAHKDYLVMNGRDSRKFRSPLSLA